MTTGYPAILMLEGRRGVVIGGGIVGERKVLSLLDAGAHVHVISPAVTAKVQALAHAATIDLELREYTRGDLRGAAVVIASTDDPEVNHAIFEEARDEGVPVNVVDDPPNSTFIAPSIIRRGELLVAISTGGASPALAVRLRERLERELGDEYGDFLALIRRLKDEVPLAPTQGERADAWYRVVDSDVMDLVRAGKMDEAYARAVELLGAR